MRCLFGFWIHLRSPLGFTLGVDCEVVGACSCVYAVFVGVVLRMHAVSVWFLHTFMRCSRVHSLCVW